MFGFLYRKDKHTDPEKRIRMLHLSCIDRSVVMIIRILTLIMSGLIISDIPAVSADFSSDRNKTKFEADIGYGYPESIGIKLKYGNQIQAGFIQSFDSRGPGPSGLEIYYHLGEKPRLLDQSPWYIMGGLAGYIFDVKYVKEYKLLFYSRAGRSFHLSREAGINFDIGPGFPTGRNRDGGNLISPVVLTGSMSLFFRF